jgi:translation initiation factor IF-3
MDYGKFLYTKARQERKKRAKERKDVLKTIRLTFGMSLHDMLIRVKKAKDILEQSERIQIEILLRGRQKIHPHIAEKKIQEFLRLLPEEMKIINQEKNENRVRLIIGKS